MTRKIKAFAILLILLTVGLLPLSAYAAFEAPPRFIDETGLLSEAQSSALTEKLDEISVRHRFDTVVAVVHTLGGQEARRFAIYFFDEHGFGYGGELDGAILLLAVRDRDFGFAGYGFAREAFTTAGQAYLEELFVPFLREDRYFDAFMAYADAVDDFVSKAKAGAPYDEGNIPMSAGELRTARLIAAAVTIMLPLLIALIVLGGWKRQLISVRKENYARAYVREGSMALTVRRDDFLHRHVDKTRRAEKSGGSGGEFRGSSGRGSTGSSGRY
jgi:uncharacterized protein